MNLINTLLFITTITFSVIRSMFSKSISEYSIGNKSFYLGQASLFLCGSFVLLVVENMSLLSMNPLTLLYSLVYGLLLVAAQYCYTASMKKGNISICTTLYSLGFIFPAVSGFLFWNERLSCLNLLGILTVIPAVIISGYKKTEKNKKNTDMAFLALLVISMLGSGGLGIMQKIQQKSPYPHESGGFVFAAFVVAGIISLIIAKFTHTDTKRISGKKLVMAGSAGVCFACCNLINTVLAGRLPSGLFFPMNNISVLLLTTVSGILIYKEKLGKREIVVLILGLIAILLLNC